MTKLEWGATSPKRLMWSEAIAWCEALGDGWRAPTVEELISVWDYEAGKARIEGFRSNGYWSAFTYVPSPSRAWFVLLIDGHVVAFNKGGNFYVRAVRTVEEDVR